MSKIRKKALPFPECGSIIREYRVRRGLKVRELAERIEITDKHLTVLESGSQMPSVKTLFRISVALNVPIEKLLTSKYTELHDSTTKELVMESIESLNENELEMLYDFITIIIPYTRKFKEY